MEEIMAYSITDLAKKEKVTRPTIYAKKDRYVWVRFVNARAKYQKKNWVQEKPYTVQYIRMEDIEKLLEKNNLKFKKSWWQNKSLKK